MRSRKANNTKNTSFPGYHFETISLFSVLPKILKTELEQKLRVSKMGMFAQILIKIQVIKVFQTMYQYAGFEANHLLSKSVDHPVEELRDNLNSLVQQKMLSKLGLGLGLAIVKQLFLEFCPITIHFDNLLQLIFHLPVCKSAITGCRFLQQFLLC